MRNVAVEWAGGKFAQDIEVGGHLIRSDEETDKGGEDTGATPHELLLSALGSCTAMTLKVYAERKGWPFARRACRPSTAPAPMAATSSAGK